MMLRLQDKEWAEFFVLDFFDVNKYPGSENNMEALPQGSIPLISAKNNNNGLKGFVNIPPSRIKPGGTISWNKDGDGGAGYAFYQPMEYAVDSHVFVLSPKNYLSSEVCVFITTILSQYAQIFGHGRANSLSRIKKERFMLPVTEHRKPDWTFMENYIRERELFMLEQYRVYATRIKRESGNVMSPVEKEWKPFHFNRIFTLIQRGKRLKTADHHAGKRPYVSSSAVNNGVDAFISNEDKIRAFEDCLTIANSGSVGKTFYHEYEFVASDHVTQLKNPKFNRYVYLFLAPIISRLEEKYSFNREINDKRINKEIILLPVDSQNEPDWSYMAAYSKAVANQQISAYLSYLEQKKFNITDDDEGTNWS